MSSTDSTAQILDFNQFRIQRELPVQENGEGSAMSFKPMLVWYPVWVMVPTPSEPTPVAWKALWHEALQQ